MTDKTKEALVHYEAALKEAFPSGATGDVFHHWNEARKALVEESSGTEQPDRHELQKDGKHPAPCARFCEATAFNIEIRGLRKRLAEQPAPATELRKQQEPVECANGCRGFFKHHQPSLSLSLAQRIVLPDAITDDSESPEYRTGWNECREVMRGMLK